MLILVNRNFLGEETEPFVGRRLRVGRRSGWEALYGADGQTTCGSGRGDRRAASGRG